jgi:hypothetical protein
MQDRFLTRHQRLIGSSLIVIAVFAVLYATAVAVSAGFSSALPPILIACLLCLNCVVFFSGWLSRDGR